jgi:hypothetical protein
MPENQELQWPKTEAIAPAHVDKVNFSFLHPFLLLQPSVDLMMVIHISEYEFLTFSLLTQMLVSLRKNPTDTPRDNAIGHPIARSFTGLSVTLLNQKSPELWGGFDYIDLSHFKKTVTSINDNTRD